MNKKILFVSNTAKIDNLYDDPSTRYRCHTPASALKRRGYTTAVMSQKEFESIDYIENYFDFFVFHRPYLNERLALFLEKEKRSKRIIADFDDLIFDVSQSMLIPSYRFRGEALHAISAFLAANAAACSYFENFSVSTGPLADSVRTLFGERNVHVLSNAVEPGYICRAKEIRARTFHNRPYKLGYFAGTATHDADFEYVSESIAKMFRGYPSAMMLVVGPAKIPKNLMPFMERIHHFNDLVHFTKLPYVMAQVETVIAPLEFNAFTVCKSGLKFFEAALVGCSVVASPIPDIDRFSSSMLRKCASPREWDLALAEPFILSSNDIEREIPEIISLVDSELVAEKIEKSFFK